MEEARRRRGACMGGGQRHATDQRFHCCHHFFSTSTPQRFQRIAPHYSSPLYLYPLHCFSLFTVPFLSITAMAAPFIHMPKFPIHDSRRIEVVHTNDLDEVVRNLDMYEKTLQGRKPKNRFMGARPRVHFGRSERRLSIVGCRPSTMWHGYT